MNIHPQKIKTAEDEIGKDFLAQAYVYLAARDRAFFDALISAYSELGLTDSQMKDRIILINRKVEKDVGLL